MLVIRVYTIIYYQPCFDTRTGLLTERFDWKSAYNAYVIAVRTHRYWTALDKNNKMVDEFHRIS